MATMGSGAGTQPQSNAPSGRPGWLTFFAVTAIVVGGLIVLTAASELGSESLLTAQRAFLQKTDQMAPNPMLQAQLDMQAKMAAAMREGRAFLTALAPLGLLAAVGLIVGGIGCLQLRKRARPLLLAALALGLIYEGARAKTATERQLAVTKVTQDSMMEMMNAASRRTDRPNDPPSNPAPQSVQQFVGTAASFATVAGMATALAMIILKLAFLIAGLVYLTRPRVRALFG